MGADFICWILEMEKGKEPDWKKGRKYLKDLKHLPEKFKEHQNPEYPLDILKREAEELLDKLQEYWNNESSREIAILDLKHTKALITGGMSWGDQPTEVSNELSYLSDAGVLKALGFYDECQKAELDNRELATVLFALRYLQSNYNLLEGEKPIHFEDAEPLSEDEIGDLCEKMTSC